MKDEKERQEEEIRRITDEKDSLTSRLSGTEKELEYVRKELDRQKSENVRLSREVKKLKMKTEKTDTDVEMQTSDDNDLTGKVIPSVQKKTFVETTERCNEGIVSKGTSGYRSEKDRKKPVMIGRGICGIGQDFQAVIQLGGREIPVMVEHRKRENRNSFFAMIGKMLFGDKSRMGIIRAAVKAGLDREQMVQIKNAICKGLLNQEIIDIINSGFDAGEMEMAVAIILAEKSY